MIAIVDDDPRGLESLENLFESTGYVVRVRIAQSTDRRRLSGVNCLITEIGMLAVDGFELHDLVRKVRPETYRCS